jgi:glycosyltransferase involved in cell wall biosynthesis
MKILEIIHRFPPSVGGSQKVSFELAKELVKKGNEVTVLTSKSMDNIDTRGFSTGRFFSLKSKINKNLKNREVIDGINVLRFESDFQFWPFAINNKMKKWLKENYHNFDIIHVHEYQSYEAMITSKICKKRPFILTAHDIIAHYGGVLGFIKKIYDYLFGIKILKNAKALIALTPENTKEYLDIYNKIKEKIHLIPNGIQKPIKILDDEKKELKLKLNNPSKIILFVARIVKYKGCQYIIKALPNIIKKYPDTKFVIVGQDQGYLDELIQLSKNLDVFSNCSFEGKVKKLETYYSIANLFILPSSGEGFGLTPIEAASYGVPSILSNKGGLKYVSKLLNSKQVNLDLKEKEIVKELENYIIEEFKFNEYNNKIDIKNKKNELIKKSSDLEWSNITDQTSKLFEKIIVKNINSKT